MNFADLAQEIEETFDGIENSSSNWEIIMNIWNTEIISHLDLDNNQKMYLTINGNLILS